jgi:hypothetical protein
MIVIYKPNPLSKHEEAKANKEGWNINRTEEREHKDTLKYELEAIKDDTNRAIFDTVEDAWRHIISKADKKNSLHEKAANIIRYYNPEQCDELNITFVPKLNKDDIPTKCTRCKKANKPKDIELRGILPDFSTRSRWFIDKGESWSMRVELKVPWDHLDHIFYSVDHATYKIVDAHCKPCSDKISEFFKDLF